jgi:chemotaxis signal transduction protein
MIATATTNLVRLTVGPVTVGLDMGRVLGIERGDRIKPAADRPDLAGRITNRAGEWPVVGLAARLGVAAPPVRGGQVVLTAIGGERHGLLVDRVSPIARLSAAEVKPVPKSIAKRGLFFDGLLVHDGRPLLLLDPDRLAGEVDLFADEADDAPPPIARSTKRRSDRLLAIGQVEYPLPGSRVVGFGIPVGCVAEIIDAPPGTAVPGAADHVVEMVEWRGGPLPVVDLMAWCGLKAPTAPTRRVVVIRTPAREPLGLLTGNGVRVLPLPLPSVPARRPITLTADRVLGIFDTNEQTLVIPDLTKLTAKG